jgi:hypothetical protein
MGPRPDFRLVITFLWSDMRNVDSDGDSHNPASQTWTWLYLKDRVSPSSPVDVSTVSTDPLLLAVESEDAALAARVAIFLARETSGEVGLDSTAFGSIDLLRPHVGQDFDLLAAFARADQSVWRAATEQHPYPNLDPTRS